MRLEVCDAGLAGCLRGFDKLGSLFSQVHQSDRYDSEYVKT